MPRLTASNYGRIRAGSVIKHTIHGDGNITDDAESIRSLMNINYDIKRQHTAQNTKLEQKKEASAG